MWVTKWMSRMTKRFTARAGMPNVESMKATSNIPGWPFYHLLHHLLHDERFHSAVASVVHHLCFCPPLQLLDTHQPPQQVLRHKLPLRYRSRIALIRGEGTSSETEWRPKLKR